MTLDKEKAALLLEKLEQFCNSRNIGLPKDKSLRYIRLARIVMQRYGAVVLIDDDSTKFLCNNYKYLKRWAFRQTADKAGSPYRTVCCGKYAKYRTL